MEYLKGSISLSEIIKLQLTTKFTEDTNINVLRCCGESCRSNEMFSSEQDPRSFK